MFQKAEERKSRISHREAYTHTDLFQRTLFKYLFFKQQIEENILKSLVLETKIFVNKIFTHDNGQLILLFQINIVITFTGILCSVIFFKNRIDLFLRNRKLLRLVPDQLLAQLNSPIPRFLCNNTHYHPSDLSARKTRQKKW